MPLVHDVLSDLQLRQIKEVMLKNLSNTEIRLNSCDVTGTSDNNAGDQIDRANFEYDRTQNIILRNRDAIQIKSLHSAINRITNNTEDFGYCDCCGVDIAFARLMIRPDSIYCLECMRVLELKNKTNRSENHVS